MNDTSEANVDRIQEYLQSVKNNAYSFETDSAKTDMITGKVVAGYQWSGDAVYTMDQADEDDFQLNFAVPEECTNLYFDGWVMLKSGINGNSEKKQAAQSFINFLSKPENAVRNMSYIGYTSVISGGDSDETTRINQMWINVRCYNIKNVPVCVWVLAGIIVVALIALSVKLKINKKNA